jgi:rsbT antagonist protein RsbS
MIEIHAIPLISLYGNLIVSVQVALSDNLVTRLVADVTRAIETTPVSGLIIDISGVDVMDSYITRCIRDLAMTARLMGTETVICGMRPVVVMTMVEMGLDLQGVSSALNLERALESLVRRAGSGGYIGSGGRAEPAIPELDPVTGAVSPAR